MTRPVIAAAADRLASLWRPPGQVHRREQPGQAATSLDDIATAAGISRAILYRHFDSNGFRLLLRHAAREPEFRDEMDRFRNAMVTIAGRELAAMIPDPSWAAWAARLAPTVAVEAVMAWLDADQPDPEEAAQRVGQAIDGIIHAAQPLIR
jgi:AcrR family transcriptional regulator